MWGGFEKGKARANEKPVVERTPIVEQQEETTPTPKKPEVPIDIIDRTRRDIEDVPLDDHRDTDVYRKPGLQ